jgi:hypothetical protein
MNVAVDSVRRPQALPFVLILDEELDPMEWVGLILSRSSLQTLAAAAASRRKTPYNETADAKLLGMTFHALRYFYKKVGSE